MYLDTVKNKQGDKVYIRHLLRESYREGKKVKHRTIANLSHCSPDEIEAVRLALKHKKHLTELLDGATKSAEGVTLKQGLSVGAVWVITDIARQIGITAALGNTNEGKLALWQVIARIIDQGSRLSAVRLAGYHAACDIVGNTFGVRLDFWIFVVKLPAWHVNPAYIFHLPCTTLSFAVMPVIRFSFPTWTGIAFT